MNSVGSTRKRYWAGDHLAGEGTAATARKPRTHSRPTSVGLPSTAEGHSASCGSDEPPARVDRLTRSILYWGEVVIVPDGAAVPSMVPTRDVCVNAVLTPH